MTKARISLRMSSSEVITLRESITSAPGSHHEEGPSSEDPTQPSPLATSPTHRKDKRPRRLTKLCFGKSNKEEDSDSRPFPGIAYHATSESSTLSPRGEADSFPTGFEKSAGFSSTDERTTEVGTTPRSRVTIGKRSTFVTKVLVEGLEEFRPILEVSQILLLAHYKHNLY